MPPILIGADMLLPNNQDLDELHHVCSVLVSRVLVENTPYFKTTFADVVVKHIPHKYSTYSTHITTLTTFEVVFFTVFGEVNK